MTDVEFSEEKAYNASFEKAEKQAVQKEKSLTNLPIRLGLAKDEAGATFILAGAGVVAFVLAVIIFLFARG